MEIKKQLAPSNAKLEDFIKEHHYKIRGVT